MISFLLKNISCTCFVYLLTMANAQAFPQKKDTDKETVKPKIQLAFVPEKENKGASAAPQAQTITLAPSLGLAQKTKNNTIDFNKMKPKNKIKQIRERYLTFYSGKKEKLKATYLQGTYAINYTQSW